VADGRGFTRCSATPGRRTGIAAAIKVKAMGRSDVRVVAQGGDGGTTDIGFGCLSGMFERNDDVLYICYDNEAYMNTGVQRSSATPAGGADRHHHAVGEDPGNTFGQGKNLPPDRHGARDSLTSQRHRRRPARPGIQGHRAMSMRGARYIHILVPCPLGWGTASHDTIKTGPAGQGERHLPGVRG
jgi:pyruvate ferredoxin oxidoreductase beta subunit